MVSNPRTASDTRRVRRLKTPAAVAIEVTGDGAPGRIQFRDGWQDVSLVRHPWRIDQHWWRGESVRRDYFRVAPEDGPPLTIYHDLISGAWFRQEYG